MTALPWHAREFGQLVTARSAFPHALLVHGPRGIGKLQFARTAAQALLCEKVGDGGAPCGACRSCEWFAADAHPDYRQLEPIVQTGEDGEPTKKSEIISVEQVRELADFVNMTSHQGRAKVIALNPADVLNPNAANALLKSLEEPPPLTHFILLSHRPHLLRSSP